jgi:hypothetical protein
LKTDKPELDPLPFLDATPLYGDNDINRLYAIQIASVIVKHSPEENRGVVVGVGTIGPKSGEPVTKEHRAELVEVVRLVEECRVW